MINEEAFPDQEKILEYFRTLRAAAVDDLRAANKLNIILMQIMITADTDGQPGQALAWTVLREMHIPNAKDPLNDAWYPAAPIGPDTELPVISLDEVWNICNHGV